MEGPVRGNLQMDAAAPGREVLFDAHREKVLDRRRKDLMLVQGGKNRRPPERLGEYEDACMRSESVSQAGLTGFKKIGPAGARLLSCEGHEPFMA